MNLVYAFPEPLPLGRARGVQTAHTVAALARCGVDVTLYHVPAGEDPLRHYGIEPPPKLRIVPLSRSLLWPFERPHSNRAFAARLVRAIGGSAEAQIIMVRHLKLAALLLGMVPGIRLVYEAHEIFGDTAPADKRGARETEEALVVRQSAAIICNSGGTAARLLERYGNPSQLAVIPNGVERPEQLPEKDWRNAALHIIYAGSLFPWKGAAELVAAAAQLEGCRIELIGGEPHRVRELAQQSKQSGAEIILAGEVLHTEVLARLASACIAVLPNRAGADSSFTSPIKLFEYMAAGCAIVASDLPAVREVLDEGDAAWARPGDAASIAEAIRSLCTDPERARALGERAREKSRGFTWEARAARVKAVLEQIPGAAS